MFRKTGNTLHGGAPAKVYARAVADALQVELGQSHRAVKTLTRWTGASERTAKNWLSGTCGPSGEHLIQLVRESDTVLATILGLCGRHEHLMGANLVEVRKALEVATDVIEGLMAKR